MTITVEPVMRQIMFMSNMHIRGNLCRRQCFWMQRESKDLGLVTVDHQLYSLMTTKDIKLVFCLAVMQQRSKEYLSQIQKNRPFYPLCLIIMTGLCKECSE